MDKPIWEDVQMTIALHNYGYELFIERRREKINPAFSGICIPQILDPRTYVRPTQYENTLPSERSEGYCRTVEEPLLSFLYHAVNSGQRWLAVL